MYRPEIKMVDCTIRDGGLSNDSRFSAETVRAVYNAACRAGIDYVELGYRNSKQMLGEDNFGPWRFCDDEQLNAVTEGVDPGATKLAIMMDAHKSDPDDIRPREQSRVDLIRVATYVKDVDKAIRCAQAATANGYDCTINVMAISKEGPPALPEALQQIEEETQALAVYVVDSFGALYSESVHYLVETYQMYVKTKEVGVHMHNNQQLAFANTIEGIIKGANYVDGTFSGLGRGAGNCPSELLLSFLNCLPYGYHRYVCHGTAGYFECTWRLTGGEPEVRFSTKGIYGMDRLTSLPVSEKRPELEHLAGLQGHGTADYAMLAEFAAAIGGKPCTIGIEEGLRMTLPGLYALESSKQGGRMVEISYPWSSPP